MLSPAVTPQAVSFSSSAALPPGQLLCLLSEHSPQPPTCTPGYHGLCLCSTNCGCRRLTVRVWWKPTQMCSRTPLGNGAQLPPLCHLWPCPTCPPRCDVRVPLPSATTTRGCASRTGGLLVVLMPGRAPDHLAMLVTCMKRQGWDGMGDVRVRFLSSSFTAPSAHCPASRPQETT